MLAWFQTLILGVKSGLKRNLGSRSSPSQHFLTTKINLEVSNNDQRDLQFKASFNKGIIISIEKLYCTPHTRAKDGLRISEYAHNSDFILNGSERTQKLSLK